MASSSRRASAEQAPPAPTITTTTAQTPSSHAPDTTAANTASSSDPSLEMTDLQPPQQSQPDASIPPPATCTESPSPSTNPPSSLPAAAQAHADPQTGAAAADAPYPSAPALKRAQTEQIGPATEAPAAKPDTTSGPVVVITLLLTSGARHPYKIDEKYLRKRNVTVEKMDPFNISVYTLKELILRDWREEWDPAPSSPSYIRLIHFGRMLDDKQALKDCKFQPESPNVVHMTVKPQELIDEEDTKTAKTSSGRERDGEERTASCRCVIL